MSLSIARLLRSSTPLSRVGLSTFSTTSDVPKHPAAETSEDPLKQDSRTIEPQQKAHETDEATKDSIRHASEGRVGEAVKDVGRMAANAAKGAAASSKLMADSKVSGGVSEKTEEELKTGRKPENK